MASEFHLFISPPTELRLKIWEYALQPHQPSRPGAHFFSITNLREDGHELLDLGVQCEWGSRCIHDHGDTYCLAAPKFGSSHSWTSNNPSAYLWDFGMWTACRESRAVIEDHYKLDYWATRLWGGNDDELFPGRAIDACVPFVFERSGENWYFPIRPNQDLVCLQPVNPDTIRHRPGIRNRRLYDKGALHVMDDICVVNDNVGLLGIKHLAFEFDSSWWDDLPMAVAPTDLIDYIEEKTRRGLFVRTLMSMQARDSKYRPETIWLIDYGLRRNTQSHGNGEGSTGVYGRKRMAFQGKDRRFVEVDRLSQDDCVSTKGRSALDFLAVLDEMFTARGYQPGYVLQHYRGDHCWFICETCDDASSALAPPPKRLDSDVRVLACERDE